MAVNYKTKEALKYQKKFIKIHKPYRLCWIIKLIEDEILDIFLEKTAVGWYII